MCLGRLHTTTTGMNLSSPRGSCVSRDTHDVPGAGREHTARGEQGGRGRRAPRRAGESGALGCLRQVPGSPGSRFVF